MIHEYAHGRIPAETNGASLNNNNRFNETRNRYSITLHQVVMVMSFRK